MNNELDPLDRLLWIDLPEDVDTDMGAFVLDPSIPLPIEPESDDEKIDLQSITWEKVIAATLLVLANRPSFDHAPYYREFLTALRPGLSAELLEAAKERIAERDWSVAEDMLLALRGLEPDSLEPKHLMARLYDRRSDAERRSGDPGIAEGYEKAAEAAYNEILSEDSAPAETWFDAGLFRYRRGEFRQAMETLEAYLDQSPDGSDSSEARRIVSLCRDQGQADDLYADAYQALNNGRINEGIELAEEFRRKRPEAWPGWFLLGWGFRLSEDWQEARTALEGAEERGCREPDLYNELAMCTRALSDFDASAAALEKALRQDPSNIKVISNMAIVMMEKGDIAEAGRWLKTAQTLDPDDPICRKLLADWNIEEYP